MEVTFKGEPRCKYCGHVKGIHFSPLDRPEDKSVCNHLYCRCPQFVEEEKTECSTSK
jgi:hypothetical protein